MVEVKTETEDQTSTTLFLTDTKEIRAYESTTPKQLLKKSRHELTRPRIWDWANSAVADTKQETAADLARDKPGMTYKSTRKKGMNIRKFKKISKGPLRNRIS